MNKILKIVGIVLGILVLGIVCLLSYVKFALPNVGAAPDMKVEINETTVARGEYLANHVMGCMDCHSTRNWSEFSGPITDGTLGKGGERFDQAVGLPGVYISKNITPAGIKDWTDGEIFRAITTGVKKNGKAIFPIMPFQAYGKADVNDVKAVIAYIRSLAPIENKVDESVSDFPMNFIINTIPKKADPQTRPAENDVMNYGKYLVTIAACKDCHTPLEKGEFDEHFVYAGGREFQLPWGKVTSANITPDVETGIGNWTKEAFIKRFKDHVDSSDKPIHTAVDGKEFNSLMPWTLFGGMKVSDLSAIYEYLHSLTPIQHKITKFVPKS